MYTDSSLNLDSLLIQLRPVSQQYQELGRAAGLPESTLEDIAKSIMEAYDGLVEVCDAWMRHMRKEDITPTWKAVSKMLQDIGQEKLAKNLLKVYSTGKVQYQSVNHGNNYNWLLSYNN